MRIGVSLLASCVTYVDGSPSVPHGGARSWPPAFVEMLASSSLWAFWTVCGPLAEWSRPLPETYCLAFSIVRALPSPPFPRTLPLCPSSQAKLQYASALSTSLGSVVSSTGGT